MAVLSYHGLVIRYGASILENLLSGTQNGSLLSENGQYSYDCLGTPTQLVIIIPVHSLWLQLRSGCGAIESVVAVTAVPPSRGGFKYSVITYH